MDPRKKQRENQSQQVSFQKSREQKIHLLVQQVLLLLCVYHVQDTTLGSGNTTYDPCSQEAGEKHLNTFLL